MPTASETDALLAVNKQLLDAIVTSDWDAYAKLCAPSLTAFEPEGRGQCIVGLDFHRYYFNLAGDQQRSSPPPVHTTMAAPHVRMLGPDAAVITYIRLTQRLNADGAPVTSAVEETRVWQRVDGAWLHVHFHRSLPG